MTTHTASPLLEVQNLKVDFHSARGVVHAVKSISFSIAQGETLAILGESGSGKSVSAASVMGLLPIPPARVEGQVLFNGRSLLSLGESERQEISGRDIGMVFQDPLAHLNPVYPVGWQIAEALWTHGVEKSQAMAGALRLVERVGIPEPERRMRFYPHQLSGGQRQRIMIAMAIAMRPKLLIADEPTTALDVTVQARILDLLKELQAETGMGMLFITHDLGVVRRVADRVAVMMEGQIVEQGEVRAVFTSPRHPYTRQLLDAVPGQHPVGFPSEKLVKAEVPLLKAEGLNKVFGNFQAVRDVSLDLKRGETLGIVGESGSGKSTVARMLLGLTEPTSGKITFEGSDVAGSSSAQRLAFYRNVQVVFQDPTASLHPMMTAAQIISEPWVVHPGVVPKAERRAKVAELLSQVGLKPEHAARYPHQFSGGQRQRIAIARAIALNPKVIICDEAVSALDVSVQAQIINLLRELRNRLGLSYLFITHDLALVGDFCDRVAVMNKGKIVEQGPTAQIFARPENPYTRDLLAASLTSVAQTRPVQTAEQVALSSSG